MLPNMAIGILARLTGLAKFGHGRGFGRRTGTAPREPPGHLCYAGGTKVRHTFG